ncbi:MAG: hypothetical protein HY698_04565 [Deltaproteobacteria bacterium]|nr:hypothetical protein [Deltaproteobacteria bacterium]
MKRSQDDQELMQYLDGELAPSDSRRVEERVAASPEAQAKLDSLGQLGELLRGHYHRAAADAEPKLAMLWNRIDEQLAAPRAREERAGGFLASLRDWFTQYRGYFVTGAACGMAGALLAISLRGPTKEVVVERIYVTTPAMPSTPPRAQAAVVESLEVSGGTGTIFQIPGSGDEAATTVIWVAPPQVGDGQEEPI